VRVIVTNCSLSISPICVLDLVIINQLAVHICHKAVLLKVMRQHPVIRVQVIQPGVVIHFLHIVVLVVVAEDRAKILLS
jgi:hypothetical protein